MKLTWLKNDPEGINNQQVNNKNDNTAEIWKVMSASLHCVFTVTINFLNTVKVLLFSKRKSEKGLNI